MLSKKQKNNFIRILKDAGLYTQWTKNRKRNNLRYSQSPLFPEGADGTFGHDISNSFIFAECSNQRMWYAITGALYDTEYYMMLEHESLINVLKENIEKYKDD